MIFAPLIQIASSLPTDSSDLQRSISALESEIKTLESSSVPLEHLLQWFTASVVIGVALEFWVIWRERRDDMEHWKRRTILPPERPSTTKFIIELLSLVLITGGIAGELGIGIKITLINGQLRSMNAELRSKSNQLVALLDKEAEELRNNAEAEKTARQKLQGEVAAADGRVEELRKANIEAASKVEAEKRKRLKLALSMLPRDFWDQSGAIEALSKFPKMKIIFEYVGEGDEVSLAEQISYVAHGLHWTIGHRPPTISLPDEDPIGVIIFTGGEPPPIPFVAPNQSVAEILKSYLQAGGVETRVGSQFGPGPNLPPGTILIEVGPKRTISVEDIMAELGESVTRVNGVAESRNRYPIPDEPPDNPTDVPK